MLNAAGTVQTYMILEDPNPSSQIFSMAWPLDIEIHPHPPLECIHMFLIKWCLNTEIHPLEWIYTELGWITSLETVNQIRFCTTPGTCNPTTTLISFILCKTFCTSQICVCCVARHGSCAL
jgi:hypothetical protein